MDTKSLKPFNCSIVTPDAAVYEGEVLYASVPAWDGQVGVMHNQSPLLARLDIGPLRLDFAGGGRRWYLLEGGFAQMRDNNLTLLTEGATGAEQLVIEEAEAELAKARELTATSGDERSDIEQQQRLAIAKVSLARGFEERGGTV